MVSQSALERPPQALIHVPGTTLPWTQKGGLLEALQSCVKGSYHRPYVKLFLSFNNKLTFVAREFKLNRDVLDAEMSLVLKTPTTDQGVAACPT